MPAYIGDARLLLRGDALYPVDLVPRGTPVFFGEEKLELTGSGRLQLAQWLTSPGSIQVGLVSRAAANRVWQHLFGEALCRTPKELGRLGESPELPELLDGLASRFVQSGWSQKELVREIVLEQRIAAPQRRTMPSTRKTLTIASLLVKTFDALKWSRFSTQWPGTIPVSAPRNQRIAIDPSRPPMNTPSTSTVQAPLILLTAAAPASLPPKHSS